MPKRTRRPEPDVNQLAHYLVGKSTEEKDPMAIEAPRVPLEVSRIMAEMGRKGGRIGGRRRADHMTKAQRSDSASKAARARWGKI